MPPSKILMVAQTLLDAIRFSSWPMAPLTAEVGPVIGFPHESGGDELNCGIPSPCHLLSTSLNTYNTLD